MTDAERVAVAMLVLRAQATWDAYWESYGNGEVMTPHMQRLRPAIVAARAVLECSS